VVTADPVPWVTDRVTELVESFEDLTRWSAGGRGMLLVDGIEALGPAAGTQLDALIAVAPPSAHVIVAGRAEAFRGIRAWQRAVTMSRTGVLLRPSSEDGDVLRIRLPREILRPVPGRGYLVEAGGLEQIQVASPTPPLTLRPSTLLEAR
jgi:S-DNA-T family DNA segregation ATPase FtsK/SpoIIIE